MYKVKQSDLIGDIKGFPIEVVQKMVERQVEQGNEADVAVFQKNKDAGSFAGGIDWSEIEGREFWRDIIMGGNFDVFFQRYRSPKNVYYRGVKDRSNEIIKALVKLGSKETFISCNYIDLFYYIGKNNDINSCYENSADGDILKRGFTELFLPEIETVEIDGKNFRKDEVVERIKGLKEIK